jgi:hypothetical protein
MFVKVSEYRAAVDFAKEAVKLYKDLLVDWNDLVDRLNARCGKHGVDKFVANAVMPEDVPSQFTQAEIQKLILLCHPDKHDGKQMAVELTQKLLKLRN